jgi:hypothetical protein
MNKMQQIYSEITQKERHMWDFISIAKTPHTDVLLAIW